MKRLLPVFALLALLVVPAASAQAVVVGIADQKPDMFADKRFLNLKIRYARYTVAWDALKSDWQRAEIDSWMVASHYDKVQPLISFGPSRLDRRDLPTPRQFRAQFRAFRKRYPWARTFATWNEANHCGAILCHHAKLAAAYYRQLRLSCPRCTILAAELLDMPNMLDWVRQFKHYAKVEPRYWGLHNYVEANRFQTTSLRQLLRRVKGKVWLTEVGGIVKRRVHKRFTVKRIPESKEHAREVMHFLWDKVIPLSPRIQRVYVYHWNAHSTKDSWDSALIGPRGDVRPAYSVLKAELRQLARRQRTQRLRKP